MMNSMYFLLSYWEGELFMSILPKKNDLGFFEIRLESIGGLGANLAGKLLSEAGVVGNGLNGLGFSSYGSEKKGSPVKGHIRFCDPVYKYSRYNSNRTSSCSSHFS